jgi:hypothetical protein
MPVIDETVVMARPAGEVLDFLMLAEKLPRSYEVSAVPGGTVLRYRLAAESGLGGAFGRAIEPVVERAQAKVVRANLGALARLLERRAA